jgi:hypothetical protein
LVWFGLVWFGLVWFGLVWFGLVWFGLFFWEDGFPPKYKAIRGKTIRLPKPLTVSEFEHGGAICLGAPRLPLVPLGGTRNNRPHLTPKSKFYVWNCSTLAGGFG